ncbi:MAG: hypothetical protein BGN88_11670 [Clostridiales bacterium 43-6]|nr:MAG: hypothetical protein BGN88_11670 [Clostridiales bacterium 43-6]
MKKGFFALLLVVMLISTMVALPVTAETVSFSQFKTIISDLKTTGSSTPRDVAIAGNGRYAFVLLSGSPATVAKIDLLTKEVVDKNAINLNGVKAIEVDEVQGVYFVSSVSSAAVNNQNTQSIYVYNISNMQQVGVVNYKTPINTGKKSDLYNFTLKKLDGKTYLYAVHQGTGWHTAYPQYFKDDTLCRIDVTDYKNAALDTSFGKDGYLYLEDMIRDGDPACMFDVAVMNDGTILLARQSDNNDKISIFKVDTQGTVLSSKFVKYAKYLEIVGDYIIVSLTGGKSITAVDINTLEPVSGVLPATFSSLSYAGCAYDSKNNILYLATDSDNKLLATGDYTEPVVVGPSLPSNGNGIHGYFPYAYFYGYGHGAAGADDAIKREEASSLLYRILKQQNQTNGFVASEQSYGDVSTTRWSYGAIEYMKSIDVFDTAENIYPGKNIKRGEIAKMIALSLGYGTDDSKTVSFTDLTVDNPYYVYVKAMVDNNIYRGNGDSTVNPNGDMTRAEFVTTINRLIERTADEFDISTVKNIFSDLSPTHWAYNDITLATNGFSDTSGENGKYTVDPAKKPARESIDYN